MRQSARLHMYGAIGAIACMGLQSERYQLLAEDSSEPGPESDQPGR
jgi:hypothetical protein